ncbi:serine/arginine-rich splicing factor 4 [Artemisia annua]|uniref:Serine/arginine-rich splicing factor 4 n=1 Tax=Artemisia annua TaxID=35608 RepID=A0A2U1MDR9_ARTAN|nr:serine/arginine-rich splicing factor 4 [Artemisia annua]
MSLYIGNIPFGACKDGFERVFQRFGRCNVRVRENARFGFVQYDDPVDAERALKTLSGRICGGLSTLEWSKTQRPRIGRSSYGSNTRKENYANRNLSLDRQDDSRTDYKNPVSEENLRKIDYEARGRDQYSRDDATTRSYRGDYWKIHCLTRTDYSTADNRHIGSRGREYEKMKRIRESESPERYRAKKLMRRQTRSTSLSDKSKSATRFASNSNVRSRSPHTGSTSGQRSAPSSELQSDENDCLTKATSLQQKEVQIKTAQLDIMARKKLLENGCLEVSEADSKSHKIAKSMSMTSEEMLMISKHYGLEQPEVVDEDISAESFFGCGRLWPWEVVYYRRLKKGPITTKNYAQRLSQNKEFGIVDKYVRSSSGWGEKDD